MNGRRIGRAFALGLALAGVVVAGALANTVVIDDVDLEGGSSTVWDPAAYTAWCTHAEPDVFTPVYDGTFDSRTDGFDAGLALVVDNKAFVDKDGDGDKQGQTLSVGPTNTAGLKVSAEVAAIQSSPTERVLYKLKNTLRKPLKRDLVFTSNMGSDEHTTIEGSSSGDKSYSTADRWIVTSDDGYEGDPVVTNVLYGKGNALDVAKVLAKPEKPCPLGGGGYTDDVAAKFNGKIPAHSTRYLLFFAEMHDTGNDGKDGAKKFNHKDLTPQLLGGISGKVQKRVLNWDLG
jgi:hypothetical protein